MPTRAASKSARRAHSWQRSHETSTSIVSGERREGILPLLLLGALPAPAQAESRQILGYAGVIGEWELTATVNEKNALVEQGILRTVVDETRRYMHAGRPGGENRTNPFSDFSIVVASACNIAG